jgi:lysyl-tRNA synthetase class 2
MLLSDDWSPGADVPTLRARAEMLAAIRAYFASADVLEVETPLLGRAAGTDPALQPMRSRYTGPGAAAGIDLYLQTSPEFAMKRLLAAGCGPVYQICKAFRDGEAGRMHNPEFTLLEWYRPGWDARRLIDEVAAVIRAALGRPGLAVESRSYASLFREHFGVDIHTADAARLARLALDQGLAPERPAELDRDAWLDLLLSHRLQPGLGADRLCFVTDYPASQAALARLNADGLTAARFEVFHQGLELGNGFHELIDAEEQAARFEADNCRRRSLGLAPVVVDRRLLDAMQHGLPDCAGVAVGLDRLLLLRLGRSSLDEVLSFSLARC